MAKKLPDGKDELKEGYQQICNLAFNGCVGAKIREIFDSICVEECGRCYHLRSGIPVSQEAYQLGFEFAVARIKDKKI